MDKKKRKKIIIIVIIIIVILIFSVLAYSFFFKPSMFDFLGLDFSGGTLDFSALGGGDANAFENVKLNPFDNSTK